MPNAGLMTPAKQPQRHQAAGEGADEADQDGVLRVREDDGRVQGGDGAGHDLVSDSLEGGHEFTQDRTDAEEDDGDGDGELEALTERGHQVVADAGRAGVPLPGEYAWNASALPTSARKTTAMIM